MTPELTKPEQVVLVDRLGRTIGVHDKATVHGEQTPLHLAFSLHLFDEAGRVLLTRRALSKLTWPGVWTNTCCGHPSLDESFDDAIGRRLRDELGVSATDVVCVLPEFAYSARDASGICENEVCPVFVARIGGEPLLANPDEVVDWAWVEWPVLKAAAAAAPFAFSPWAVEQFALLPDAAP